MCRPHHRTREGRSNRPAAPFKPAGSLVDVGWIAGLYRGPPSWISTKLSFSIITPSGIGHVQQGRSDLHISSSPSQFVFFFASSKGFQLLNLYGRTNTDEYSPYSNVIWVFCRFYRRKIKYFAGVPSLSFVTTAMSLRQFGYFILHKL